MSVNRDRIQAIGGATAAPLADDVSYGAVPPGHDECVESSPSYMRSYIASDCPPGFQGGWSGWMREEQWFQLSIGSLDGVAFVRVSFATSGANHTTGKDLVFGYMPAADGPPADVEQYTELGHVDFGAGHFDVPAGLLTESATNYVCLAPGWFAQRNACCCSGQLLNGLEGPLGGVSPGGGEFNSAGIQIDSPSAVYRVVGSGGGMTPWSAMDGAIDGSNRVFGLPDWNGKGVPEVRIGAVVYADGSDFTYDVDAAEITMSFAPWTGAQIEGRWRT